ncbi:glycosyltransferase family 2 protein [Flavobacteriales bacterium]|jgi:glycosyltransferase involved in cell wall biosynthesis|nr:glycosyltransferase family 2 protein [Flavobacteriales bacterium]MDB9932386.1 glycosyltransferase family 2 protein [Flavobacteriales bacterium]MDC0015099.1 glycosyltransferase family 2 protein [Flavobacteriales bacterium]MDC1370982.1 glycosyltransferase family 2 protein [Flavobacteriales bacterium]MDG1175576.1 glycosyltransferase family 2 protein [Flavobacteriales bacterium]
MQVDVIIPAFNEQNSIGSVINDIPKDLVRDIIVVDNNSSDETSINAKNAGATVLKQPLQGYGNACLKGIEHITNKEQQPDVVVFLDADYSDFPQEMSLLLNKIWKGADMVIGNRVKEKREKGSMTVPQIFGNWLACNLMKIIYGYRYQDLGPFRAVKFNKLQEIGMVDKTYGWTVEMQVKALNLKMNVQQVDLSYRKRIGHSKISGTVKGSVLAGYKIITTIFKYK